MREISNITSICLVLFLFSSCFSFAWAQNNPDFTVYEVLTCYAYDSENHYPIIVSDYYEVTDSEVFLWINMSYIRDQVITFDWIYPNNTLYQRETIQLPETNFNDTFWNDQVVSLSINGSEPSRVIGDWRVEIYTGESLISNHTIHIYDKESDEWGYYAEILSIDYPARVRQNQNFTVSVEVNYSFKNNTLLTPGIWDPETSDLLVEVYDEVGGEGTQVYVLTLSSLNLTGSFQLEATAFYLVADEWFIDEEGVWGFTVEIIEERNQTILYAAGVVVLLSVLAYLFFNNRIQKA